MLKIICKNILIFKPIILGTKKSSSMTTEQSHEGRRQPGTVTEGPSDPELSLPNPGKNLYKLTECYLVLVSVCLKGVNENITDLCHCWETLGPSTIRG